MRFSTPIDRAKAILRSATPLARTVKGIAGLAVFVAVIWWAWQSVGGIEIDWRWVAALLIVGAPLAVGVLTIEQHVSIYLAGVVVAIVSSFRTSLAASAANYLPLPGAAIVRVGALANAGSGTGRAVAVAATLGVQWLAITTMLTAPGLLSAGMNLFALAALVGGLVVLMASWIVFARRFPGQTSTQLLGICIVTVKVFVNGFNTYLGLLAVGADVDFAVALLISASGVLASAIGVFPGGLGLREFLSGVLGAIGGADPALAALGAVVTRSVLTVGLGLAIAIASMTPRAGVEVDRIEA